MSPRIPSGPETDAGNRSRLLQAATDAFAEQGYEAASLRSIADNAGVSFQLIAHYFGTKEQLWLATVHYLFERYFETGKGLGFTPSGNLHEQFHNHLRLILTDVLQRPQLHKIWVQEYLANGDRYRNVVRRQVRQLHEQLGLPYFREVVRLGIVTRYSPEEICLLFSACLQQNVVSPEFIEMQLGASSGTPKSVERQIDLLFEILTRAADADPVGDTLERAPAAARERNLDGRVVPMRLAADGAIGEDRTRLEREIEQLKRLVGSLSLENKVLLEALAATERATARGAQRSGDD
jgi:TetR/AcrR family transcriptional regulator